MDVSRRTSAAAAARRRRCLRRRPRRGERRAVARLTLVTLIPAGTRYDRSWPDSAGPTSEHERVTPPGRRTLLYRGGNGGEHHEVAIELHDDRVREITCITSR